MSYIGISEAQKQCNMKDAAAEATQSRQRSNRHLLNKVLLKRPHDRESEEVGHEVESYFK
jgi:hypothetical protein